MDPVQPGEVFVKTLENVNAKAESVSVDSLFREGGKDLALELIAGVKGMHRRIEEAAINRPGLALCGFFDYFARKRIQVLGAAECAYLSSLTDEDRRLRLAAFFSKRIPCVVVARNKRIFAETVALADEFNVPLFRTHQITKTFINSATLIMENLIAPRTRVHGTMVEIMGTGVLIEGLPGAGKSEAALGLLRKGCALVSDDITALRRDASGAIIASSIEITRYHLEIRGLGIIHVPSLFGVAAVRQEKRLDLVATLVRDVDLNNYDRAGQDRTKRSFLGVDIPQVMIGLAPGRDAVNLIETAALDHRLRLLGHDAAKELDDRLVAMMMGGRLGTE